ncbi:MAG: hypothetical protein FWC36_03465 [Spirochaetes bacterium]|nr:hypothetical protein [Spirochaetota bacterium]
MANKLDEKMLTARLVGKAGLILVIIGFFMPFGSGVAYTAKNAFEIATYAATLEFAMMFDGAEVSFALRAIFGLACIGVILGTLLLIFRILKKDYCYGYGLDFVLAAMLIIAVCMMFPYRETYMSELLIGAYLAIAGIIVSLVCQLAVSLMMACKIKQETAA